MTDALIRHRVEDWAKAIGAKDIAGVMSYYAPNIASFDIDGLLRYAGVDNKRRAWSRCQHVGPRHDVPGTNRSCLADRA